MEQIRHLLAAFEKFGVKSRSILMSPHSAARLYRAKHLESLYVRSSIDVYVSAQCPQDTVYVCPAAEYLGALPIRQDICVLGADHGANYGFVVYEEIGMGVQRLCVKTTLR